jgi:hypothetical protein
VIASLAPGTSAAEALRTDIARLQVDALFGELGPEVTVADAQRLDVVLAALDPDGDAKPQRRHPAPNDSTKDS